MVEALLDELEAIYLQRGARCYEIGGAANGVTQLEHALQCAALAESSGACDALVAAALLHDLGHLIQDEDARGELDASRDDLHQYIALPFLRRWFGPQVLEPIRLHVDAKRWLCAAEPGYLAALSTGSRRSLELQGGAFSSEQAAAFLKKPHAADAIALRRWDDRAKTAGLDVPSFAAYRPLLREVACDRVLVAAR